MQKIGIFGGTFDPVHLGHTSVAKAAADRFALDRVIFVPAAQPPHKEGDYRTSSFHRYKMTCIAAAEDERFCVSDFEIMREGESYTYITAEHFKNKYKNAKLYFIIGDEAYSLLNTWKNPERALAAMDFIVVARSGNAAPKNALYLNIPPIPVSSSEIRRRISCGEDVSGMLHQGVYEYILKNGLYKG